MLVGVSLLLLGILIPYWFYRYGGGGFHPISLYVATQFIPVGIAHAWMGELFHGFSSLTWIVFCLSGFCFICGSAVSVHLEKAAPKLLTKSNQLDVHKIEKWMWLYFGIFIASYSYFYLHSGAFPMLTQNPEAARMKFVPGSIGQMAFSQYMTAFSLGVIALFYGNNKSRKFRIIVMMIAITTLYALTGNRGFLLVVFVFLLSYYDIQIRKIPALTAITVLMVGISIILGLGWIRYGQFFESSQSPAADIAFKFATKGLYAYLSNGAWNLEHGISLAQTGQLRIPTWGFSSFEGILGPLHLFGPLATAYGWDGAMNHSAILVKGLNSAFYQWPLYKDFGLIGVSIFPFIFGIFVTHLFQRAQGSQIYAAYYSHFAYYILVSSNILVTVIPMIPIATIMLYLAIRRSSCNPLWLPPKSKPA